MSTGSWVVTLGAAFVGVLFLVVGLVPLASGRVELRPTERSIAQLERDGFPEEQVLRISGGVLYFPEADVALRAGAREPGHRLRWVSLPVVSPEVAARFDDARRRGEALDASRLRLVARFPAEAVERLWEERVGALEAGALGELSPVPMTVVGETLPFRHLLSEPLQSAALPGTLQPASMRGLDFEKHHDSLGRTLRDGGIGLSLLLFAFLVLRYGRDPGRRPPGGDGRGMIAAEAAALGLDELDGLDDD